MLLAPQSISLPSPLPLPSISKTRGQRALALRERQGRDLLQPGPRPAETLLIRPLALAPASAPRSPPGHRCTRAPSTPFFSPSGMEASWRQVAGGRGRARGRATAAPSSGNGFHLRGAGGGREKASVGAAAPGPSPGGAATAAAAGSSARRSAAGSEALRTSVAGGEDGSRPRSHLGACEGTPHHCLCPGSHSPSSCLGACDGPHLSKLSAATHRHPRQIPILILSQLKNSFILIVINSNLGQFSVQYSSLLSFCLLTF